MSPRRRWAAARSIASGSGWSWSIWIKSVANDYSREPIRRRNPLDLEWLALNEGQAVTRVTGEEQTYRVSVPHQIQRDQNYYNSKGAVSRALADGRALLSAAIIDM